MKMAIEVFEEGISSAPCTLKEVLAEMNLESLRGFDLDLPAILELFPPEQVIETIGLETVIQHLNTSDLVKFLASTLSEQEREAFIEQLRQPDGNGN